MSSKVADIDDVQTVWASELVPGPIPIPSTRDEAFVSSFASFTSFTSDRYRYYETDKKILEIN